MKRDLRVKSFKGELKHTKELLCEVFSPNDYIIVDRSEMTWSLENRKNIILLKTFAPLSGHVIQENLLKYFPIEIGGKE